MGRCSDERAWIVHHVLSAYRLLDTDVMSGEVGC